MNISNRHFFEELFRNDKAGERLFLKAMADFQENKADRAAIELARNQANKICEEVIEVHLKGKWTDEVAKHVKQRLNGISVETKCRGGSKEFLELYRQLGFLSDYTTNFVAIRYPQAAANTAAVRAIPPHIFSYLEFEQNPDGDFCDMAGELSRIFQKAQKKSGLSYADWASTCIEAQCRASRGNMLAIQNIEGPAVYLNGPFFYADAEKSWTLTFSTGSGLPDPLEWNGSHWFSSRYNVSMKVLTENGAAKKHPIRPLNFEMGIVNNRLPAQRIYVWQRDKTSEQLKKAYALACVNGRGQRYLNDAWNQLTRVFSTDLLKIIELDHFDPILTEWTRISARHIMLSHRPGTPQAAISHGCWLTPSGANLNEVVWHTIRAVAKHGVEGGILACLLNGPSNLSPEKLIMILSLLASLNVIHLVDMRYQENDAQRRRIADAQRICRDCFQTLWNRADVPGTVKEPREYPDAPAAAMKTLARLLGVTQSDLRHAIHGKAEDVFKPSVTIKMPSKSPKRAT